MHFTILHKSDPTEKEKRRLDDGVAEIIATGHGFHMQSVTQLQSERLLVMERPRLPRFCVGPEPAHEDPWPRDKHGGLRWLRKQLAEPAAAAAAPPPDPQLKVCVDLDLDKNPEPDLSPVCERCEQQSISVVTWIEQAAEFWWRCHRCGHLIQPQSPPEKTEHFVELWTDGPGTWTAPGYVLDVGWGIWPGEQAEPEAIRQMLRSETTGKFWPITEETRAVIDKGVLFATTGEDHLVITENPPPPPIPEGMPPPVRDLELRDPHQDYWGRTHISAWWHVPADDGWPPGHSHIEWQWGRDGEWYNGDIWGHSHKWGRGTGLFPYYGGTMKAASTDVHRPGDYQIRVRLWNGHGPGPWTEATRRAEPL